MKRLWSVLVNVRAALWLARHWRDLRQETRDNIFQDMLRIRGYLWKIAERQRPSTDDR